MTKFESELLSRLDMLNMNIKHFIEILIKHQADMREIVQDINSNLETVKDIQKYGA